MTYGQWTPRCALFSVIVSLLALGCGGRFAPIAPRSPGVAEGLRARVTTFDAWPSRRGSALAHLAITIEDAVPGARIAQVALADGDQLPCDSGDLARSITVDGDPEARAIRSGSEVIVTFPSERLITLGHPGRVDMTVSVGERRSCMTLDFTSSTPDLGWSYEQPYDLGFTMSVGGFTKPVVGAQLSSQVMLLAGRWVGPVRLALGSGFALDMCNTQCCRQSAVPSTESQCPTDGAGSLSFPIALRADVFPIETGYFALGFGVHYLFVAMGNRLQEGVPLAAYHTLTLAPIVAYALHPLGLGYPGGAKAGTLGIEFPIGVATAVDDNTHFAGSLGVNLSVIF